MLKSILAKALLVTAMAAGALPIAASAGEVQNRIHTQDTRINQGVGNGELTRSEYGRIQRTDYRIEAQRNRDLRANDGHLTKGEYRQLNNELNRNSANIYYDKHNLSRQPGAPRL